MNNSNSFELFVPLNLRYPLLFLFLILPQTTLIIPDHFEPLNRILMVLPQVSVNLTSPVHYLCS